MTIIITTKYSKSQCSLPKHTMYKMSAYSKLGGFRVGIREQINIFSIQAMYHSAGNPRAKGHLDLACVDVYL
jgi:hypothetical protein